MGCWGSLVKSWPKICGSAWQIFKNLAKPEETWFHPNVCSCREGQGGFRKISFPLPIADVASTQQGIVFQSLFFQRSLNFRLTDERILYSMSTIKSRMLSTLRQITFATTSYDVGKLEFHAYAPKGSYQVASACRGCREGCVIDP